MRTKQQTDSILKWILNNESIQITYCGEIYRDCDYQEVFDQLSCDGTSAEFRIKQKPQIVCATVTYFARGKSVNCTVDLSCENTAAKQLLYKMAQPRERVVVLTEQCYNELLCNSTLNLKGN